MTVATTSVNERVQADDQAAPTKLRNADIVMKGGITSGVVYPGAVWALAKAYRFRSIGGASAGAIAAAATAAAEYGRQSGAGEGFEGVRTLPNWLAADEGRLFGFFRAEPETASLFRVATAFVGLSQGRLQRVLKAFLVSFPVPLLIGLLPAIVFMVAAVAGGWTPVWAPILTAALIVGLIAAFILPSRLDTDPKLKPDENTRMSRFRSKVSPLLLAIGFLVVLVALGVVALVDQHGTLGHISMGLILMLVFAFVALVVPFTLIGGTFVAQLLKRVPNNMFGLCTGNAPTVDASKPSLTPWLADYIDRLAGVKMDDPSRRPLTFGDLSKYQISLQVTTSNLTAARGYRLPFDDGDQERWYFDPEEFGKLFPPYVVNWMAAPERHEGEKDAQLDGKILLPNKAEFPVVVAARMSLSFPFLLSAVPLYTPREMSARRPKAGVAGARAPIAETATSTRSLAQCWFSDGGLVSNFPLHFFDSPLPRWPTFAINLRGFPKGEVPSVEPADNIFLVGSETGDSHEDWNDIEGVAGFAGSLKNIMENSHDNEQMLQVGYRDRIAHVRLADYEGGLNLKMPAQRISDLSERGASAGKALRTRFTAPPDADLSWANHRWVRYRITMANLQNFLERFAVGYQYCTDNPLKDECPANEPTYQELISRAKGAPPARFYWEHGQQDFASLATKTLIDIAEKWRKDDIELENEALKPHSELRNVPKS